MTKALFHGSMKGFRGKIGELIFRLLPDGTTVVTMAQPKKTRRQKKRAKLKRSPRQQAHNSNFRDAVDYARPAAKTNPLYAELAAAAPMKTAYNFALSDWFNPPQVHRIERKKGCIRVNVSDDVLVTKVRVTVLDAPDGNVLERGEAVRRRGDWWEFASQTDGKTVVAEAWDLPGHVTRLVP
ncbi:MAG TPA: hypothetical protein VK897_08745 [Anaerolineales bacterium]|nr:hypothetical protein [Anaerolineales bacterium]